MFKKSLWKSLEQILRTVQEHIMFVKSIWNNQEHI